MEFRYTILFLILIEICIRNVQSMENELNEEQKEILQKFKREISSELPHDYMKEDYYLARWLRAKQFDMGEAKEMLKNHIKWREENKMDEILTEDWSTFLEEYPERLEGVDKEGRPVFQYNFGAWNFEKLALANKGKNLVRWLFRGIEVVTQKIQTLRKSGKNVTQWDAIVNMEHMSMKSHVCGPQCFEIYTEVCSQLDKQYPGSFHKIICINTPPLFSLIKDVTWPLMTKETQNAIELLGHPIEWKGKVSGLVAKDQFAEDVISQKYFGPNYTPPSPNYGIPVFPPPNYAIPGFP